LIFVPHVSIYYKNIDVLKGGDIGCLTWQNRLMCPSKQDYIDQNQKRKVKERRN
jgi:hypothetical protein